VTRKDLKAWRLKQGWTQEQAGLWWGCPASSAKGTWYRWESGRRKVPRQLVKRIRDLKAA
jgi:transcriptional regulator with XRE-family HTH domain